MAGDMDRPTIAHQPALDGLRAVSVLAVLLFHGEVAGFSGGYLGVSVFFTLSGFLITTLLIAEHLRADRIAVGAFYVRRAKRLLPASLSCIAVIAVLSATTDLFAGVADLERDLLGARCSRWPTGCRWRVTARTSNCSPARRDRRRRSSTTGRSRSRSSSTGSGRWRVRGAVPHIGRTHQARTVLVGFVTAVFARSAGDRLGLGPDAAYWATPARAAEILVGCLAAFVVADRELSPRWHLVAAAALTALVAAFVWFPSSGGPAYGGALPIVGVVSALLVTGLQVPGPVRSALSWAPRRHGSAGSATACTWCTGRCSWRSTGHGSTSSRSRCSCCAWPSPWRSHRRASW
ncbi:MAG: acyltransferase [Ilumatobacteraceae bacterium]